MTILSWPHWSDRPWNQGTSRSINFHDYFVMAPLKRRLIVWWQRLIWDNFHDYFVMAPLKHNQASSPGLPGFNFHDYFVMAPLKLTCRHRYRACHRLTSMTILSWPHWSAEQQQKQYTTSQNFHDYFVMAPLKHVMVCHGIDMVDIHFHDYFVMAPLKRVSIQYVRHKGYYFHDYFVMAPLKRHYEVGFLGIY